MSGQTYDKGPLKVKFRPFEDDSLISLVEIDQKERNLIFVNNKNIIRVFEIKMLLRNNIGSDNMIFT